ncbi:hypothetical protein AU508_02205 [Lonsdalea populi]|nr:hypothetical protein AU508_02205 [Lonsdalea populi]
MAKFQSEETVIAHLIALAKVYDETKKTFRDEARKNSAIEPQKAITAPGCTGNRRLVEIGRQVVDSPGGWV